MLSSNARLVFLKYFSLNCSNTVRKGFDKSGAIITLPRSSERPQEPAQFLDSKSSDSKQKLSLHHAGALARLYASLFSQAHLGWIEKAERPSPAVVTLEPRPISNLQRRTSGSRFLAALAAEPSDHKLPLQFSGMTRQ
jgi:hypothetical protein